MADEKDVLQKMEERIKLKGRKISNIKVPIAEIDTDIARLKTDYGIISRLKISLAKVMRDLI